MKTPKTLFSRLNATFETAPTVEWNSNVFTARDYMSAVSIAESQAYRRINELLRRNEIRRVRARVGNKTKQAYEFIGKE